MCAAASGIFFPVICIKVFLNENGSHVSIAVSQSFYVQIKVIMIIHIKTVFPCCGDCNFIFCFFSVLLG